MMNILLDWANVHCVFVLDGKYYMHSVHKRERERGANNHTQGQSVKNNRIYREGEREAFELA